MSRWFCRPKRVDLNEAHLSRARRFAATVVGTVDYSDSNQRWSQKIERDHYVSKLGEEAVALVLASRHLVVRGPDYTIYRGREKSWEADLFVAGVPLHVKTQTADSGDRYGHSWTFQNSARRRDPVLLEPAAWVCFVTAYERHCLVYPPYQMHELTLGDPKLTHLRGKKRVAYAVDLPRIWQEEDFATDQALRSDARPERSAENPFGV